MPRGKVGGSIVGFQLLLVARFPDSFAGVPIDRDDVFRRAHDDDIADGNRPGAGNRDDAALDEIVRPAR